MSCYLASAYITNIIWLIRITNLCSSKCDGENAKISEPKTTKQTFVSRCTWASYEAFWKVRPWFRKQWQTQWSISTMRKTLSIRESHEGFRARELRGSKDDLCNACRLSIIGQVSQQANSGREWEINYTWLILQVNFCCLWVIFFSTSLEAGGLHLPDLHARASHLSYISLVSCVLKHATWHECCRMLAWPHSCTQSYNQTPPYGHPLKFGHLIFYGQLALSLRKESPYIFSKFNPLNTDTPLIRALSMTPSESLFMGFDCIRLLID